MTRFTQTITYVFEDAAGVARQHPRRFLFGWFGGALVLFGVLGMLGWLPPVFTGGEEEALADEDTFRVAETIAGPRLPIAVAEAAEETPTRIMIDKIGVDTSVSNPTSQNIEVLDEALVDGAVRYPGSATLEEEGNMFLFGHSSYLPKVINPAYKAFNGLKDLEEGDIIRVQSDDKEHIYKVATVKLVDANEAWVDLSGTEKKLTLSTCNTFGQKQDRFVVEAHFVGSYTL